MPIAHSSERKTIKSIRSRWLYILRTQLVRQRLGFYRLVPISGDSTPIGNKKRCLTLRVELILGWSFSSSEAGGERSLAGQQRCTSYSRHWLSDGEYAMDANGLRLTAHRPRALLRSSAGSVLPTRLALHLLGRVHLSSRRLGASGRSSASCTA